MEAREALAAYQLSVERNPTIRSFLEIAGDFGPPGERVHRLARCFTLESAVAQLRLGALSMHHATNTVDTSISSWDYLKFEVLLACQ